MRKIIKLLLFLSLLSPCERSARSEGTESDQGLRYEETLAVFYEARRYQSLGDFVKALQKYEEAFRLLREFSVSRTPLGLKARRKMDQIEKDVKRIEERVLKGEARRSSSFLTLRSSAEALRRFEEWRRQEDRLKRAR